MSLPEPYYQDDHATIYHADCRELLPEVSADVIVTDPPYGIAYNREAEPQRKHRASNRQQTDAVHGDEGPFDPAHLIGRPFILWGANNYARRLPDCPVWLAWDKVTRNGLALRIAEVEFAATNCVGRPRIFRHLWSGAYRGSECRVTVHPTQKPVALMTWCLSLPGVPSGTVLDPYMGSGPTLRAAKDLGRKSIGIEIEERYCEIAARRLSQEVLL